MCPSSSSRWISNLSQVSNPNLLSHNCISRLLYHFLSPSHLSIFPSPSLRQAKVSDERSKGMRRRSQRPPPFPSFEAHRNPAKAHNNRNRIFMDWLLEEFIIYTGLNQFFRILASSCFRYIEVFCFCLAFPPSSFCTFY
ncbi:hypothetical protein Dimus_029780 [Dionaea muscipula]